MAPTETKEQGQAGSQKANCFVGSEENRSLRNVACLSLLSSRVNISIQRLLDEFTLVFEASGFGGLRVV